MKVLIDGQEVECLNDVKVIYEEIDEENNQLHITCNSEGMVTDVLDECGSRVEKTFWGEPWHIAEDICH